MRNWITFFGITVFMSVIICVLSVNTMAQAPQKFNYQAVCRDNVGNIVASQPVSLRFTLHDLLPNGNIVYQETQASNSNSFGLVNLAIGTGTVNSGNFASIPWATGPKYLEVELNTGSGFNSVGAVELLSVPYALYASQANVPGVPGPTGPQGIPGNDGAPGIQGVTGPAGPQGLQGNDGLAGADGLPGPQGVTGKTGPTGPQGLQGLQGNDGPPGADGLQGPPGNDGLQGPKGVTGKTGTTGPQGPQGLQGNDGLPGADGLQGPPGNDGAPGADGAQGPPGNDGAPGADGAQGPPGPQGQQGPQGNQGPQGPAGSANISGSSNYVIKFTSSNSGGSSQIYDNGSFVGIGVGTSPLYSGDKFEVQTVTRDAVNGYCTSASYSGVYGQNFAGGTGTFGDATSGTGVYGQATSGVGVLGTATGSSAYGSKGINYSSSGTGMMGIGNGTSGYYLSAGSGGAFTGSQYGLFARSNSTSSGNAGGYFVCNNNGGYEYVSYYNGSYYKILGSGSVSTIVKDKDQKLVTLHAPETPEIYFQDYGEGQLVNGKVHISVDSTFALNIVVDEKHPMRVFIQLYDNVSCMGVIVTNRSKTGFDVIEMNSGTSNTMFSWSIVCNRADEYDSNGNLISKYQDLRFEAAPGPLEIKESSKDKSYSKNP